MLLSALRIRSPQCRSLLRSSLRKYTTQRRPPPVATPRPPVSLRLPSAPPPPFHQPVSVVAERLYNDGARTLYTAPLRFTAFRVMSWTAAALSTGVALYITIDRMREPSAYERKDGKYKWLTTVSNAGVSFVLLGLGAVLVNRVGGGIRSIELVKVSGVVYTKLNVPKVIPSLQQTIIARPRDIEIHQQVARPLAIPEIFEWRGIDMSSASAAVTSVLKDTIRVVVGSPFYFVTFLHHFLFQTGVASVRVQPEGSDKQVEQCYLDIDGTWAEDGDGKPLFLKLTDRLP